MADFGDLAEDAINDLHLLLLRNRGMHGGELIAAYADWLTGGASVGAARVSEILEPWAWENDVPNAYDASILEHAPDSRAPLLCRLRGHARWNPDPSGRGEVRNYCRRCQP